ncbi:hypothetical protein [Bradyrhizobium australiense]|uniref:Uncharacterized protein n=1 Tax=Bradyrhizobium australiense TaxID=2721161 RepID=A0A7Y4GV74_9BRAD|nr:hypothetical protein [Bradyrhizobium australiense]NOJ42588.1 hypothetical protein [Bradyrhizobium australiense]
MPRLRPTNVRRIARGIYVQLKITWCFYAGAVDFFSELHSAERLSWQVPARELRRSIRAQCLAEPAHEFPAQSKAFFLPLMKEFIARRTGARGANRWR